MNNYMKLEIKHRKINEKKIYHMETKQHEDSRGISGHECISLHRCIRTTSRDAIVLIKHWLNISRSLDHQKRLYRSMH